jgi:hypothetical protein
MVLLFLPGIVQLVPLKILEVLLFVLYAVTLALLELEVEERVGTARLSGAIVRTRLH